MKQHGTKKSTSFKYLITFTGKNCPLRAGKHRPRSCASPYTDQIFSRACNVYFLYREYNVWIFDAKFVSRSALLPHFKGDAKIEDKLFLKRMPFWVFFLVEKVVC